MATAGQLQRAPPPNEQSERNVEHLLTTRELSGIAVALLAKATFQCGVLQVTDYCTYSRYLSATLANPSLRVEIHRSEGTQARSHRFTTFTVTPGLEC